MSAAARLLRLTPLLFLIGCSTAPSAKAPGFGAIAAGAALTATALFLLCVALVPIAEGINRRRQADHERARRAAIDRRANPLSRRQRRESRERIAGAVGPRWKRHERQRSTIRPQTTPTSNHPTE